MWREGEEEYVSFYGMTLRKLEGTENWNRKLWYGVASEVVPH
jgi:hypothetical protein